VGTCVRLLPCVASNSMGCEASRASAHIHPLIQNPRHGNPSTKTQRTTEGLMR
jgi:hypothetical protein